MPALEKPPIVFVVSDSAGETGESVVRAAAAQFSPLAVDIRRVPFVQEPDEIARLVDAAARTNGVIVFTLVIPRLRDCLFELAGRRGVRHIDLLGPIIASLEADFRREARHQPGIIHQLDKNYFQKVEAVEFAVKYDDGRDPLGVLKADIVLIGVSRTSKTPLSMFLAHKTYKVANVPLLPELVPPPELFTVSPRKIIGLTIQPDSLNVIRKERLKTLGLAGDASYAKVERIRQELDYAGDIMARIGCKVIDVTHKAVEETAGLILELFQPRAGKR